VPALLTAAPAFAVGAGHGLAGQDAFGSDFILVGRHRGQHVGHQAPGGGREVHLVPQRLEADVAALEVLKQGSEARGSAPQPVEAPDDDPGYLAGDQVGLQALPAGAVHGLAGELVLVPLDWGVGAGLRPAIQVRLLAAEVLLSRRDPGVDGDGWHGESPKCQG